MLNSNMQTPQDYIDVDTIKPFDKNDLFMVSYGGGSSEIHIKLDINNHYTNCHLFVPIKCKVEDKEKEDVLIKKIYGANKDKYSYYSYYASPKEIRFTSKGRVLFTKTSDLDIPNIRESVVKNFIDMLKGEAGPMKVMNLSYPPPPHATKCFVAAAFDMVGEHASIVLFSRSSGIKNISLHCVVPITTLRNFKGDRPSSIIIKHKDPLFPFLDHDSVIDLSSMVFAHTPSPITEIETIRYGISPRDSAIIKHLDQQKGELLRKNIISKLEELLK